jgi:putative CocE/NonD family hydrolase
LHAERDNYWAQIDGVERAKRLKAPVLLMAGWYDPFLPTQLNDFVQIRQHADQLVAARSRLIVGPWTHAETVRFPDGTLPRHYRLESLAPSVAWFDEHLLGKPAPPQAPVRIYTMGIHEWRDEQEWPLARTQYTSFYLHSAGNANTAAGDGTLTRSAPYAREPADVFVYDPHRPVPSAGGAMLDFKLPGLIPVWAGADDASAIAAAGIARQNGIEARDDVLVYTTNPLEEPLEITGPIQLILYVSTSAPSTDFSGKLVDVFPDGSAYNISDGIVRRNYDQQSGEGTEIHIDLWPTSTVVLTGHQIRLEVSSSNFPRFDRNPNTGGEIATETHPITAAQTIFHTDTYPSRLILPLIPR